ncbi:MAG: hypothetical protein JWP65_2579 [Ramlibacter sp.]|jgi:hypothetical protein|uniref:hypothetical protein n=1 Tax=Ramlibacter sp. TaxID=1917967 RepID=UPI0026236F68|nr:hypothetical protein [Ramlibacter sp.]MDB5752158.1 hypothetical protein [Ramlibacter sp.]
MRLLLPLLALLACGAAAAQAPLDRGPELDPRKNQKIERIRTEDGGNRIEEVRVGGETQSITVQPKAAVPPYEMQPNDLARSRPAERREGLSGGGSQRVWNLLAF